ncbi:MAG: GlxA family transcriptional regulator [Cellvibrionaceae bacterium]
MPSIAFVLTEHMLATSSTWPSDMVAAANQAAKRFCPDLPRFSMVTVASEEKPIRCHTGIKLYPDHAISSLSKVDIIYLPALWRNPRPVINKQPELIDWLQQQYENGAIICGVGTGCCFMAETGLLNQKPATTHWYYFDQFQKNYPQVQLKRQHFITQAGRLYCAASINSLADLTIHFIQRFFNQDVAQHVQRHFSHEVRKAYETVSYFEDDNTNHPDEDIFQTQLWMQNNIEKIANVADMAEQFGMSVRNFSRRFKRAIGKTPMQYLQELRLNTARDLLQSSNLTISEIADKVGYQDVSHFSQIFRKQMSITPRNYRTTVRAKLFNTKTV